MNKRSNIAPIAIFFAVMLVIHYLIFSHFQLNQLSFIFQSLLLVSSMVLALELHSVS